MATSLYLPERVWIFPRYINVIASRGWVEQLPGIGYVLRDLSGKYSPEGWARKAIGAYKTWRADRIIAERNFGGDMVLSTLKSVDPGVPVKLVVASRGKAVRAEPVAAQYEQGRIRHVGNLGLLEDQLCEWNPAENGPSPDRLDALVWCMTEL